MRLVLLFILLLHFLSSLSFPDGYAELVFTSIFYFSQNLGLLFNFDDLVIPILLFVLHRSSLLESFIVKNGKSPNIL